MKAIQEVAEQAALVLMFENIETLPMTEITFSPKGGEQNYSIRVPKAFLEDVYATGFKDGFSKCVEIRSGETLNEVGKRIIYNIVNEIPNNLNEVGDENVRVYQKGKVKLDAEYKKYVEHWGDPIDPINYKLYSIETDMPCFHPDNRLFTIKEFRDLRDSSESFRKMWKLKQESIDAAELLYDIVKKEVDELNKDRYNK